MARDQPLVLLADNIAPSQIKRMAHISAWTYFTRREGLSFSATILAALALLFLGLSHLMSSANDQVQEFQVKYTKDSDLQSDSRVIFEGTKTVGEFTNRAEHKALGLHESDVRYGSFIIKIDEKINQPVYFQYVLENFYQNHMWYMRSVDGTQLRDAKGQTTPDMSDSYCRKLTQVSDIDPRIRYPCGLIAYSVFNDTFFLEIRESSSATWEPLVMDSDATAISWKSDYETKHRNPEDQGSAPYIVNPDKLDFWLLELFPPVECVPVIFGQNSPWKPIYLGWRRSNSGKKIVDCDFSDGPVTCKYSFQRFDLNGRSCATLNTELQTLAGDTNTHVQEKRIPENWGLQSGHFVNWMRMAGLPTFRKMYGKINRDIPKDSQVRVNFISRHHVPKVEKHVLIGNLSWFGGKNNFASAIALFSAIGAFLLSMILLCLAMNKKARVDVGTKVLHWN